MERKRIPTKGASRQKTEMNHNMVVGASFSVRNCVSSFCVRTTTSVHSKANTASSPSHTQRALTHSLTHSRYSILCTRLCQLGVAHSVAGVLEAREHRRHSGTLAHRTLDHCVGERWLTPVVVTLEPALHVAKQSFDGQVEVGRVRWQCKAGTECTPKDTGGGVKD